MYSYTSEYVLISDSEESVSATVNMCLSLLRNL